MLSASATPAAIVYAAWASQMLGELKAHFAPQSTKGAARLVAPSQRSVAALAQACDALESSLDAVDVDLLRPQGLLGRVLKRPSGFPVFFRQLADVAGSWDDVRIRAAEIERARASIAASEKRAVLELELAINDCQPCFSRVTEWLALASQDAAPASQLEADGQFLRSAAALFDHMRVAEARARHLLEQQLLLSSIRTLLADMLVSGLAQSVDLWQKRISELVRDAERGCLIGSQLNEFARQHIALRRLVHKVGATCLQLRSHEDIVGEAARDLARANGLSTSG